MLELTFTVEAEPVPAPRPRVTKRGVFYSKRYVTWKTQIEKAANNLHGFNIKRPIHVIMRFRTDRYERMDIDNLAKGVLDALTGILWDNDSEVDHITAHKSWTTLTRKAGVTVTIQSHDQAERIVP